MPGKYVIVKQATRTLCHDLMTQLILSTLLFGCVMW